MNNNLYNIPQQSLPKDKLVPYHKLPSFIMERRLKFWLKHTDKVARFPLKIPEEKKEIFLQEIFKVGSAELSNYFHPNIKPIGGVIDKNPKYDIFFELAKLQYTVWGAKDGSTKEINDYLNTLKQHNGPSPIFAYFKDDGKLEAAVFPVQIKTENMTTWDSATGNGTRSTDSIKGDLFICPMICSYMTMGGVAQKIILNAAIPYARILYYFGYIDDAVAYSRPADYGYENRHKPILEHILSDPNYSKFHARNGATIVCVVEDGINKLDSKAGGFGFIAGYISHLIPDYEMQSKLYKLGEKLSKFLNI